MALTREYLALRGKWYSSLPDLVPAAIHIDLNASCSLYNHDDNEIRIALGEFDVDELTGEADPMFACPSDAAEWPKWKQELVHEMLHEYQHKALGWSDSASGRQLHVDHKSKFTGQRHGPDFFTAVDSIAPILGVSPEQLIEYVR
jgi:hypothetical protein